MIEKKAVVIGGTGATGQQPSPRKSINDGRRINKEIPQLSNPRCNCRRVGEG